MSRRSPHEIRPIRSEMIVPERPGSDYRVRIRGPWWAEGDRCVFAKIAESPHLEGVACTVVEIAGPYIDHNNPSDRDPRNGDPWLYCVEVPELGMKFPVEGKHLRCVEPASSEGA